MALIDSDTRRQQIRLALATQADWERVRGFANHRSFEEVATADSLPILDRLPIEGILVTVLDEFLELYEAIIHPEPKEAELLELTDGAAFLLRLYSELLKSREQGATYSRAELERMTNLVSQAMLAGEIKEFPNIERDFLEKEAILADLRRLMEMILGAYCNLVGVNIPQSELADIVKDVGNIAGALLVEGREITKPVRNSLLQLMLRPIVQVSPQGHDTIVSPDASEEVILTTYAAIEEFAHKHYGYGYLWFLVGSLYAPPNGKNTLNYPYPLPPEMGSYQQFAEQVRSRFPGRVIPLDFDVYHDSPDAYIQRWEQNHPGQKFADDFTIKARIPNFSSIADQLR